MSETQAPSGLMQALEPLVKRRPVHIIVSDGTDGALHVVVQPIRVDDKEDADVASGFSIEGPAAELDADLPQHLAEQWVPARIGLQSVVDQIKAATEQTRQTTVGKAKDAKGGSGRKSGGGADAGAQTSIAVTGTAPGAPAAVPADAADPVSHAPDPIPDSQPPADASSAQPPAETTPAEPVLVAAGDGVSDLFT